MEKINLQTDAQEFLFYSYFGVPYAGTKKEEMKVACFKRAYRDFCRTLSFDNEKKYSEDMSFACDVYSKAKMTTRIEELI